MDGETKWISAAKPRKKARWEDTEKRNEWIEDWLESYYAFKEYEDCILAPEWERFLNDYVVNHAPRLSEQEERELDAISAIWPLGALKSRSLEPLAALLREIGSREALSPHVREMVDDLFPIHTGKRGRPRKAHLPKRRLGKPQQTEEERRKINPVHNADEQLSIVKRIISSEYPDQTAEKINDAAIALVSRLHRVKNKTLRNHSKRSKNDHRRASNHPKPKH
jgi:hypothetical protein